VRRAGDEPDAAAGPDAQPPQLPEPDPGLERTG
jgi:hypothetical protein